MANLTFFSPSYPVEGRMKNCDEQSWQENARRSVKFQYTTIKVGTRELNPRPDKQRWWTHHQHPGLSSPGLARAPYPPTILPPVWGASPKTVYIISTILLMWVPLLQHSCALLRVGSDKATRDTLTENCHHGPYKATLFSSIKRAKEWVANIQRDPSSSGNLPALAWFHRTFPLSLEDTGLSHVCFQTRGHQPFKNRIRSFVSCYFTGLLTMTQKREGKAIWR